MLTALGLGRIIGEPKTWELLMVITEAQFLLVRFLADRKRSTLSAKSPPDPAPGIDERCFALMSRRAALGINCSRARDGSQAPAPVPVCGRFRAFPPADRQSVV